VATVKQPIGKYFFVRNSSFKDTEFETKNPPF